jgi:type I restriction enzyme S subunit
MKISEAFAVIRNGASIRQDKLPSGIPITRIETISDGNVDLNKLGYASIDDHAFEDYYLEDGDILMSHINSIPHLGKVALYSDSGRQIIHGMNLLCLKANRKVLNPKYAFYYFKNPVFRNSIKRITKKSVNQASFNITALKELSIPVPALQDQLRIANILSKAEMLIVRRKESLRLLDEFLKSTFLEMFGDPVRNEKAWQTKALNGFGDIITGSTPPRIDENNYSSNHVEWIKTDNIELGKLIITNATEYLSVQGAAKARFVTSGGLLVACIAGSIESIGRAALTDRRVSFNQQINAIQPNNDINSYFLYWLFKISKAYIQKHATKGMKKILTKGDFEKINMIKPPIMLQTQFARVVEKTEALKAHYHNSLQELEYLYAALSQKAFSEMPNS